MKLFPEDFSVLLKSEYFKKTGVNLSIIVKQREIALAK